MLYAGNVYDITLGCTGTYALKTVCAQPQKRSRCSLSFKIAALHSFPNNKSFNILCVCMYVSIYLEGELTH